MKKRMVIFGGNGFVGQSIAKEAIAAMYEVVCISRSGRPQSSEKWLDQVEWVKADVFKPKEWLNQIESGDVIVDAIGILFEKKQSGITYQKFNYEIVPTIIENLDGKEPSAFVFVSAAHGLPLFSGYFKWKKEAERYLAKQPFRSVIIRPSLLYGKDKKFSRLSAYPVVLIRKIKLGRFLFGKIDPQPIEELGKIVIGEIEAKQN